MNAEAGFAPAAPAAAAPLFAFDNSYARDLEGGYVAWTPAAPPAARLLRLNRSLAVELGLDADTLQSPQGVAVLSGATVPPQAQPLAQAYAGHQFGGFSPQLGDGRALLLGELIDRHGQRRDIAFKGSGRTPFSRGGDGKAVLGPVLREYLMGEAMFALGIPTTRALAAVATGETVQRETPLPGALLVRVASSHLRVGTFQYFAARENVTMLRRLADYAIARHDPALADRDQPYLELLRAVVQRQAVLIARWMGVGFIHGVMNTDNMTISGETIDYGPCAFMEAYDPRTVFSSIDHQGRYAYGNQPGIAQWNLTRFAETLLPLLDDDNERAVALATEVLQGFASSFSAGHLAVMRDKLGLGERGDAEADRGLAADYLGLLHEHRVDFTLGWRRLRDAAAGDEAPLRALFADAAEPLAGWLQRWRERSAEAGASVEARLRTMARANPAYIPRNHRVEAALAAAVQGDDLQPFERLLAVLQAPFDERAEDADFALPAAAEETAGYRTFCGT